MDPIPAFTKLKGFMDLNDIASKVKLLHPINRGGGVKLMNELSAPCLNR